MNFACSVVLSSKYCMRRYHLVRKVGEFRRIISLGSSYRTQMLDLCRVFRWLNEYFWTRTDVHLLAQTSSVELLFIRNPLCVVDMKLSTFCRIRLRLMFESSFLSADSRTKKSEIARRTYRLAGLFVNREDSFS